MRRNRRAAGTGKSEPKNCWRFSHPVESNHLFGDWGHCALRGWRIWLLQFFRGVNRGLFGNHLPYA
jgi:hypothetical protein